MEKREGQHSVVIKEIVMFLFLCVFFAVTQKQTYAASQDTLTFAANMGSGINIGNAMDAWDSSVTGLASETYWGNPKITKQLLQGVKNAGFKTVRLPVTWQGHMDSSGNISADWMNRVDQVVNQALDCGLYVIIDMHHDTDTWMDLKTSNFASIRIKYPYVWKQIANHFKGFSNHLVFEGINEPRLKYSSYEWTEGTDSLRSFVNELNKTFVETVRATGGNNSTRYLMIGPYVNNYSKTAMQAVTIPDDHCIVSIHAYVPYDFTQNTGGTSVWDRNNSYYTTQVTQAFQDMNSVFVSKGIPVVVTEFGCINKNNLSERVKWIQDFKSAAAQYGINCIWWDNGSEFKIIDRNTGGVTVPSIVSALTGNAPIPTQTPNATVTPTPIPIGGNTGWVNEYGNYRYYINGVLQKNKWLKIDGKWYYVDGSGNRKTNWFDINGVRYFFGDDGVMYSGLQNIWGQWYYFGSAESGSMVRNSWVRVDAKWYYFEDGGTASKGLRDIGGGKFYFDETTCVMTANGWKYLYGSYYFFKSNGYAAVGWLERNGFWYYMDSSGVMQSGLQTIGEKRYYLSAPNSGVMVKNAWRNIYSQYYYFGADGAAKTGWLLLNNHFYYMDNSGVMQSDWRMIDGAQYYLGAANSGVMAKGWTQIYGSWYYFDVYGRLVTGFRVIGNHTYYLDPNNRGCMVTGTININGTQYQFDSNGVMQTESASATTEVTPENTQLIEQQVYHMDLNQDGNPEAISWQWTEGKLLVYNQGAIAFVSTGFSTSGQLYLRDFGENGVFLELLAVGQEEKYVGHLLLCWNGVQFETLDLQENGDDSDNMEIEDSSHFHVLVRNTQENTQWLTKYLVINGKAMKE